MRETCVLLLAALALVFPSLCACSHTREVLEPQPVSSATAAACEASASAVCARAVSCTAAFVTYFFGSIMLCEQAIADDCDTLYDGPGAASPPATCDLSGTSCADMDVYASWPHLYAFCPVTPGRYAVGAACLNATDCASGFCGSGDTVFENDQTLSGCGTCQPQPPPYTPVGTPGSGCIQDSDCQPPLRCVGGNLLQGACGTQASGAPRALGAACTTFLDCDLSSGLICATSGTCQSLKLVSPGEACGLDNTTLPAALEKMGGLFDVATPVCSGAGSCEEGVCTAISSGDAGDAGTGSSNVSCVYPPPTP